MSAIGELAPDFQWTDQRGRCKRLRDLRGHSVLVLFSANAWDPARRYQLQDHRELLKSLAVAGRIPIHGNTLGAMENDDDWCEVEGEDIERFPLLADFDSEGDIAERFGVRGVGAIFLIDPDGRVRWRYVAPDAGQVNLGEALNSLRAGCRHRVSRREFLAASLAVSLALSLSPPARAQTTTTSVGTAANDRRESIVLHINGTDRSIQLEPRVTLLDALRERLKLTGTKKGCDHGQCGACTVLVNDRRINACLMLAVQAQGHRITTIEGLAQGGDLHPMQAAFIRHDGFQCGYCTPGQICSAAGLIAEGKANSADEIRELMSGNICRCGAYSNIAEAITEVAGRQA
jgi:xanthine dehydrogenase YagT iron-sulfur-binding subunit